MIMLLGEASFRSMELTIDEMEQQIGDINLSIVRDLRRPPNEHAGLVKQFYYITTRVFDGDGRKAALLILKSSTGDFDLFKLICERWKLTFSEIDLDADGWRPFRKMVINWAANPQDICGVYVRWIHEKYGIPREAVTSDSNYIIHNAIIVGSGEVVEWLADNFGVQQKDAYEHIPRVLEAISRQDGLEKDITEEERAMHADMLKHRLESAIQRVR